MQTKSRSLVPMMAMKRSLMVLIPCLLYAFSYQLVNHPVFSSIYQPTLGTHISPDVQTYLGQSSTALSTSGPSWYISDGFFRPPLASFLMQYEYVVLQGNVQWMIFFHFLLLALSVGLIYLTLRDLVDSNARTLFLIFCIINPVIVYYVFMLEDIIYSLLFVSFALFTWRYRACTSHNASRYFIGFSIFLAVTARPSNLLMVFFIIPILYFFNKNEEADDASLSCGMNHPISANLCFGMLLVLMLITITLPHLNSNWDGPLRFPMGNSFLINGLFYLGVAVIVWSFSLPALFCLDAKKITLYDAIQLALIVIIASLFNAVISVMVLIVFCCRFFFVSESSDMDYPPSYNKSVKHLWLSVIVCSFSIVCVFSMNDSDVLDQNIYWGNGEFSYHKVHLSGYGKEPWVNHLAAFRQVNAVASEDFGQSSMKQLTASTVDYVVRDPLSFFYTAATKALRTLSSYEIPRNSNFDYFKNISPFFDHVYFPFSVMLTLGIFSLIYSDNKNRKIIAILIAISISQCAIEVVFFNASRYRALGLFFLQAASAVGAVTLVVSIIGRRWKPLLVFLSLVTVLVTIGSISVDKTLRDSYLSTTHFKLARNLLVADGHTHDAGEFHLPDHQIFLDHLASALSLDEGNIEAFILREMYRIYYEKDYFQAKENIDNFKKNVDKKDKVYLRALLKLEEVAMRPEVVRTRIEKEMQGRWLFAPH